MRGKVASHVYPSSFGVSDVSDIINMAYAE